MPYNVTEVKVYDKNASNEINSSQKFESDPLFFLPKNNSSNINGSIANSGFVFIVQFVAHNHDESMKFFKFIHYSLEK